MKLSAPKNLTFYIAIVVAVIGLLGQLGVIAAVAPFAFWLVFAAFVLLALGNLLSGLLSVLLTVKDGLFGPSFRFLREFHCLVMY